ncbi:hypothetical protein A3842_09910 [Paenibacillus sp. P3E]|uniref:hypothetical protein n=1 Tax=unclassified Paenibacillus TaxID=185978 RepID=UPI00093B3E3D|nr:MULTISPECIES: hypothetical protein [unclassified Paenibacillus]OKP82335.1 hypothetical protein A3842_09910 [Paenibacillus sp. P3E]OKP84500.1 hypothetical protein A3848_24825 [Paenibacillus sp. P32E]
MKLRLMPVLLTSLLSAALLFGGWYSYREFAVQEPLQKIVSAYEGVNDSHISIKRNEVTLKLDLKPGTKLRELVQYVNTEGRSVIDGRTLKLDVEQHSSQLLDEYWDKAMFSVAEAMESRKYTLIPAKLDELKSQNSKYSSVIATTEIDDSNVYVSLSDGKESKFIILPRVAATMGVWNNA